MHLCDRVGTDEIGTMKQVCATPHLVLSWGCWRMIPIAIALGNTRHTGADRKHNYDAQNHSAPKKAGYIVCVV